MRRRARFLSLAAVVTTLCLVGAACGDDDDDGASSATTAAAATTTAAAATTAAGGGATTTAGGATTTGATDEAALEELIAAAKEEGSLTFYSAATENIAKRISDAFSEKYGISTEFVRLSSSQLQQRYAAEADAGNIPADLIFNAGNATAFTEDQISKGNMYSIEDAEIPILASGEFPEEYVRGPNALVQIAPWQFAYNTDSVEESAAPKTWEDLLKPEFKDQILIANVAASDAYVDVWAVVLDNYGPEYFEKLKAQNFTVTESGVPAVEALGAGEAKIAVPVVPSQALANVGQGAPVAISLPPDTSGVEMQLALTAPEKARHPNAARLMAEFVMSEEGNKLFNDDPGNVSVYDEGGLPADYVAPNPEGQAKKAEILQLLGMG
jgi:iron(III) transport system substrate-binding protein